MSTAFVTFVYPVAIPFFGRFINSLNNQIDKDFTLIIFNDGCSESQLNLLKKNNRFQTEIIGNTCSTISENRYRAFSWLANSEYKNFIFGDIDDLFSKNRVSLVKSALLHHEIVFNELSLVSSNPHVLKEGLIKNYLKTNKYVTFDMVKYVNLIGFSHLGVRKEAIQYLVIKQFNKEIAVVDWAIIVKLLVKWACYFEELATTYYMMHENNIALENGYTYNSFLKEVEIKFQQYKENYYLDPDLSRELDAICNLKELIADGKITNENWMDYVVDMSESYYPWWNKLKCKEELENEIQIRRDSKF